MKYLNSTARARDALLVAMTLCLSNLAQAAPQIHIGANVNVGAALGPPVDSDCVWRTGSPCLTPERLRHAYGVAGLVDGGYSGAGQTIVFIESYGSPTLASDLSLFDAAYGLPPPPSLQIIAPLGPIPPFNRFDGDQQSWAYETSLDVEWAHAMAPAANIVVLVSPVDETLGVQGMPEFLALEQYALDHHLGHIISQSWGTAENTLFTPDGKQVLSDFEAFYQRARDRHVTVLAASGDLGAGNISGFHTEYPFGANGLSVTIPDFYPFPTVGYPASSPQVTTIGGTELQLDANGNYESEQAWQQDGDSSGGGVSQFFPEPAYQVRGLPQLQSLLAQHRGIPDVSSVAMDLPICVTFIRISPDGNCFVNAGGTSAGPPVWAGIVAVLNQYHHRPLGFLNTALYRIGGHDAFSSIGRDIVVGDNVFQLPLSTNGETLEFGYQTMPGWDPVTGWGTPDLSAMADHRFESRELEREEEQETDRQDRHR